MILVFLRYLFIPTNVDQNKLKGLLAGISKFNILINLLGGANISKNHVYAKSVDDSKQLSIFCDLCKFWVHSKCNCLCIEQ